MRYSGLTAPAQVETPIPPPLSHIGLTTRSPTCTVPYLSRYSAEGGCFSDERGTTSPADVSERRGPFPSLSGSSTSLLTRRSATRFHPVGRVLVGASRTTNGFTP